ncbi:MAG: peptidoglycan DD-metalloendopeptidase family protein [Patescibacteria group bacterium]
MVGKAVFSGLLVSVMLGVPFILLAQSAADIQNQINDHQAQIEALNKEIAQYEKELAVVGEKKQTLQTAVNALDISVKQTQAKVRAKQSQIATTELQIKQLGGDIQEKEQLIAVDSAAIAETVRSLHESESASLVEMILAHNSIADVWDDTENIRVIQENMHGHVLSLLEVKEQLTEDKEVTEKKREELVVQKGELSSQEQSLAVQKKEQQNLLTQTKNQESNYQKLVEEKKTAKASFEAALNELESKLQYTLDPSHIPPAGKGILRWPLDAITITQQFGKTADSGRLYVSGTHNGVDFRASIGTPVKAALSGIVQGTGNTDAIRGCYSYGKWVLIKHGNGLTTLYAHLSQINVVEGQNVATGQVIGFSGVTGYATGPHLHFTVYASDAVQVRQLGSGKGCNSAIIPVSALSGYLNPLDYL